ncbi:MAG: ArsR family transcriptional regulator [Candidatus Heimdallarchaeota archaeon]
MILSDDKEGLALISNALGNPVRLQILANLARGEKYILQLVRELGQPQQVVYRHLRYLEKKGLIKSSVRHYRTYKGKDIPPSRQRKYYRIDHTLSISIDIGPFLFYQDVTLLSEDTMEQLPKTLQKELREIDQLQDKAKQKLQLYQKLLELEQQNKELEENHHKLLVQRHHLHERLKKILNTLFPSPEEQEIAYQLIGQEFESLDELARYLDIHPESVKAILSKLRDHIDYPFLEPRKTERFESIR